MPILYYILPSNGKNHGDRRPTSSEGGAHEKQAHSRFSTASLSDFTIDDFSDANAFRSFGIEVTRARGSLGIFHPWIIRRAVNVNQSCRALCACTLGTFSHTSRFPISCALRTCLSDGSAAVNVDQSCRVLCACTLGTFSHTSRFPIACALRACFLDGSVKKNPRECGGSCIIAPKHDAFRLLRRSTQGCRRNG